MIIGKRRLKQIKLILVSPTLEKITVLSYLVLIPLMVGNLIISKLDDV